MSSSGEKAPSHLANREDDEQMYPSVKCVDSQRIHLWLPPTLPEKDAYSVCGDLVPFAAPSLSLLLTQPHPRAACPFNRSVRKAKVAVNGRHISDRLMISL